MNVKEALCCSGVNPVEIVGTGFSEGAGQTVNATGTPGNAENSDTNILTAPVATVIALIDSGQIPRERIPSLLAERPDVAEACSSEQRGGEASGWQPIETAPRDGRSIMLFIEGEPHCAAHCFAPISICDDGTWWDDATGDQIAPIDLASHWMPLPAPPATLTQGASDER